MAEKSDKNQIDTVFWYNVAPRYGQQPASVPQKSVATYEWRLPVMRKEIVEMGGCRLVRKSGCGRGVHAAPHAGEEA